MTRVGAAVTLREAIDRLLHPDAAGDVSLLVADDPSPRACVRLLEEGILRAGHSGLTCVHGEVDEATFIAGALHSRERPLLIASPGATLWRLLADHRAQITRTAPFVIIVEPNLLMARSAAHVQSLAGTNMLRIRGSGYEDAEVIARTSLGELRRILLRYYTSIGQLRVLASDTGVDVTRLNAAEAPDLLAFELVIEARKLGVLRRLLSVSRSDYPMPNDVDELVDRIEHLDLTVR